MATGSALSNPPDGPDGLPQVLDLFPRGPEGDAAGGGVRPPGVETGEDSQDTGGPGGPPRAPPASSRPWRKSWKRKYRDGSSYRDLNLLQREILRYIEDNADDRGICTVSTNRLSKIVSSKQEVIPRATVQSALKTLRRKGHLVFIKDIIKGAIKETQSYRRVNFSEFQEPKKDIIKDVIKDIITLAEELPDPLAKAKSAPKKRERPKDPVLDALLDALRQQYLAIRGEQPDIQPRHTGDLLAVRKAIGDDLELQRRWREFLKDEFYPTKNMNRFRAAYSKYAKPKSRPLTLRPVPGIDTDE